MSTTRRAFTQLLAASALAPRAALADTPASARKRFDVAVIGAGVFGSWTAHALRAEGLHVVLVDAFGPGNSRSSSGGESRITRSAYGDRELYAHWAAESLVAWKALSRRSGALPLFENTGVLTMVPDGDHFAEDSAAVLSRLGVRHERLTPAEAMRRFPQFRLLPTETAIFEPEGGALMARRALQALVAELTASGMALRIAAVRPPQGTGSLAAVETTTGEPIAAERFVFACGPWLPTVFPELLGARLRNQRAEVFFLGIPGGDARYLSPAMPAWIDRGGIGDAYGFPGLEGRGCKLAVDALVNPIDPDAAERTVTQPYIDAMRSFVRQRLPGLADAPIVETRVCQYEYAGNKNYVLDRHPDYSNVWIAGGGSGHGFKNGPMVGRYMAGLISGRTPANPLFSITRA